MSVIVRRPDAAESAAMAPFAGLGLLDRARLRVRWRTCPFPAVAEALPASGAILEVGCGHGLLSVSLALAARDRSVIGIDPDERKVRIARRAAEAAASQGARCRIEHGGAGSFPDGPFDGIAIVDVLYLLDPDRQRDLLQRAAEALAPSGVLVVKETAREPRWKYRLTVLQETLAVRVLGITRGDRLRFTAPESIASWMVDAGLEVRQRPLDAGFLHPHHLLVGRRS